MSLASWPDVSWLGPPWVSTSRHVTNFPQYGFVNRSTQLWWLRGARVLAWIFGARRQTYFCALLSVVEFIQVHDIHSECGSPYSHLAARTACVLYRIRKQNPQADWLACQPLCYRGSRLRRNLTHTPPPSTDADTLACSLCFSPNSHFPRRSISAKLHVNPGN